MRRCTALIVVALILAGMGATTAYAQTVVLQIGSSAPVNSPWDLGLKKIAAEWSRISGGKVRMVFPKSVANASQEDMIQKLKFTLDGAVLDTTGLGFVEPDVFMLSMPSVIRNDDEYDKAIAVAVPIIRERLEDRYEIVAFAKGGWIRFFSNQQIRTPDDLRKVRMGVTRSQDSLAKLLQSVGVRTVKADSASTLLQFNAGALDAMYSSPLFVGALWAQYKRVITHMSPFKVAPFFGAVIIKKQSWDRVPDSLKPALREAAERVSREIGEEAVRLEDEGIVSMQKSGLIVPPYDAADDQAWNTLYAEKMRDAIAAWYSPEFSTAIYAALGK
ncbi:MAG: TRAP transporter substrate-binding protein DctP [Spirochaetales bacterium]|nr:TRAP transporter substrate-binding protein DctP [Spirochaetales bacterium]